ncbi:MAG: hypothetical protein FWC34_03125 [Bacteroidetes bacterium]|nr:hypothetical protein [Bacteroidota bacterium]MCL2303562.1 hypothetical protein [Lentimicrobiaceae bacterium]
MKSIIKSQKKFIFFFLLLSPFSFLLSPFSVSTCFAQANKPQKNSARFVYQSSLSLAYGIGNNFADNDTFANNSFSFEIQQLLAYQFNNYFFTGVGTGLDFWFYEQKVSAFIPIFANATVKFTDKKMAPFLFANIGYAFKWQAEKNLEENIFYGTKAGIYFQSGFGLNITFSEKLSLLFSAYYKLQQSAIQYRESELLLTQTPNQLFHFVGVRIGLLY